MSRPALPLPDGLFEDSSPPLNDELSVDFVYRTVKASIIQGQLGPNYLTSEEQIAARLGTSRTPVHRALLRLQSEGWLTMSLRRGLRISSLTASDMVDVYEALMALEIAAVYRLTEKGADPALLQRLEGVCAQAEEALARGDLVAWGRSDSVFHRSVIVASGNKQIAAFGDVLMDRVDRARYATLDRRPTPIRSNEEHRALLDALVNRDSSAARRAVEIHRRHAISTLVPILDAISAVPPA
ncbi:MAG: GntR family transcriptional regulator [Rhodoglobus sp.]|nr:GntR family transcriptional regulator [Rhodoglobus sp.]